MIQQTKKTPLARLWHSFAGELQLHRDDFWQLPLLPLVMSVLMGAFLTCVFFLVDDSEAPIIVGMTLQSLPVSVAAFTGVMVSGVLFSVYYKLGVQMGQTRRAMLLRLGLLSVIEQAFLLGCAVGLGSLVTLGYSHYFTPTESLLILVPWWGWVLMLTLPLAVGTFGGAVMLRFGRKGFWVLYAIFMSVILLPQLFTGLAQVLYLDQIVEGIAALTLAQPQLVCLVSLVPFAAGVGILWRLPIRE